ncbi:MAG: SipW-dependent-type signal peptide-containing protein [Lachnospiraceae bacterium]|nr:SipW-dependent-type signal peptide-containing protein [Lachnospiraceae bacterium]
MNKRHKKILGGAVTLSLLAAVVISGTLAYLTDSTEQRVNNFTFDSDAVKAMLTEPEWDGVVDYEYDGDEIIPIYGYTDADEPIYGYQDGDESQPVTDKAKRTDPGVTRAEGEYGDEQAQNMIPGQSAQKNPIITNTGETADVWVAAKITFVYGEGSANAGEPLSMADMQKVLDAIEIDYKTSDADNWVRSAGTAETEISQVFYYKQILSKDTDAKQGVYGDATTPIFTAVTVKTEANNAQMKALEEMGGFAIWIEGFAVQSDVAADADAFVAWGEAGNVVFEHTPTAAAPADVTKPGIIPAN